jgi:hypothetical protein
MADQRKDKIGMSLLFIAHLVCCGLLLIFLAGGISIGMVVSYLHQSLVPLGIAIAATSIVWVGYRLWRRSTLHRN